MPVVLLADVRSVGVQGDGRTYGHPVVLRPVTSEDAMTADWARVPYDVLERISTRITNEVREVNRVGARRDVEAAGHHRVGVSAEAPLAGLRVADFSRVLAGPLATMTLADLGADVVKVERPGSGDDTRAVGSAVDARGVVVLRLRSTAPSAAWRSTCAIPTTSTRRASWPPGRRAGRELPHRHDGPVRARLRRARGGNPRLVYCSITGFGSGAGAALPGYDFVVQAVGGLMSITGAADGEPHEGRGGAGRRAHRQGRRHRRSSRRCRARAQRAGQHVEVNLLLAACSGRWSTRRRLPHHRHSPGRMGNRHPSIAPYETLRCRDGLMAVACGNDDQFRRLCGVLGVLGGPVVRPHDADPAPVSWVTNERRVENRTALDPGAGGGPGRGRRGELGAPPHRGGRAGRAGRRRRPGPRAAPTGSASTRPSRWGRAPPQVRHPVRCRRSPLPPPTPPPALGQHTHEIRSLANLQDAAIRGPRHRPASALRPAPTPPASTTC